MVAPLHRLLESDPGLLQEINFHVSTGQLAGLVEVDPYELSLEKDEATLVITLYLCT